MRIAADRRPAPWDAAVAFCLAVLVVADRLVGLSSPRPTWLVTGCGLVICVALLARSRRPLLVMVVAAVFGALPTLLDATVPSFYAGFVTVLAAVYAVALYGAARDAVVVPVLMAAVVVVFAVRTPTFLTISESVSIAIGVALAMIAGRAFRLLRERADVEMHRADLAERERSISTREAVAAERERIARELHDVIAHDVAVMVVHAGAAERLLDTGRGDVGENLAQIRTSGRKAVDELRLLLDMLRDDDPDVGPRPGLASLAVLLDDVRGSGLPVSLEITGQPREVAQAVDLSAYRLVQEALTNALKHAAGSRACVTLDYGTSALTATVVNTRGASDGPPALPTSGHGLVGMRERVRVLDGTLCAGPSADGGWEVCAVMPMATPAS